MKRIAGILVIIMIVMFGVAACGSNMAKKQLYKNGEKDSDYIKNKGSLVVGITEFKPMDYKSDEEWVGFDADMAREFSEYLGVDLQFVEIDWDNKVALLENGDIDCVWNGMTLTDKVTESMACTKPYLRNSQVIIVPKENAGKISDVKDCTHYLFAVESGSSGEQALKELNYRYLVADTQNEALGNVSDGNADAAVADSILAAAMVGDASEYPGLECSLSLSDEEYGVGFRKDSDMADVLDSFFDECYEDGSMMFIAEKYGVDASVIER
jgi:polar amino acid transport system substrate-binding protein